MGRLIKAEDLWAEPVRLGSEDRQRVASLLRTTGVAAEVIESSRQRVVDLALLVAERIVGEALALDPGLLTRIYDRAIAEVGELRPVELRVHPDDRGAPGIDELAQKRDIAVVVDREVGPGGCRVTACGVVVDATLAAGLEALGEAMQERARGR